MNREILMPRLLTLFYGSVCYLLFLVTFCYAIVFVGDVQIDNLVPWTVDAGGVESPFSTALFINVALLGLFGLQHSIMARPEFKAKWTKIVPMPIERSTYVLLSSLLLLLLFWQWRPMPSPVWQIEAAAGYWILTGLYFGGYVLILYSSFMIDHFDLFGLRQVFLHLRQKP